MTRKALNASRLVLSIIPALVMAQSPVTHVAPSFRPQSLANYLIETGILLNLREFTDIPLSFTVVDSLLAPVPDAALVLEFPDSVTQLSADRNGQVTLAFDGRVVNRNPVLRPASPLHRLDFSLSISRGKSSIYHRVNLADIGKLQRMAAGDDFIWYPQGFDSIAGRLAVFLPKARVLIWRVTALEPVRWGTVLSVDALPVAVSPGKAQVNGLSYDLFPFSLTDETAEGWCLGNLHEWVEQTLYEYLPPMDPKTRWIHTGIASYVEYAMINELATDDPLRRALSRAMQKRLRAFLNYLNSAKPSRRLAPEFDLPSFHELPMSQQMMRPFGSFHREENWILKLDLLKWHIADPFHPVSEEDFVQYQLASWFWWDICQRNGETVVGDFLRRVQALGVSRNEQLLPILAELTGGRSIRGRLHNFVITELEQATLERLDDIR